MFVSTQRRPLSEPLSACASELEAVVADLEPATLHGESAAALVPIFARIEAIAATAKALCAARVAEAGTFRRDGYRDGATWLAARSGTSVGEASEVLATARRLTALPALDGAARSGELSPAQARACARAASLDPASAPALGELARHESFAGLRRACEQVAAAARGEQSARARELAAHRHRFLRGSTDPSGAFRLSATTTPAEGARLMAAIDAELEAVFSEHRCDAVKDTRQAYAIDALVRLSTRGASSSSSPKSLVHLRVDLPALRRGELEPGECCEIPGVGPVSLTTARSLMGDAIVKVVITDGIDVHSVCHVGRSIPSAVRTALIERDRTCAVPGCDVAHGLEIDHRIVPFSHGGATELWNLVRLCHHHHFLRTHQGFRLEGAPGSFIWRPPDRAGP